MANKKSVLEAEIDFYMANLDAWLPEHKGKYVGIQGNQITGFWTGYDAVLRESYKKFGVDKPFLVRQVSLEYKIHGRLGQTRFVYHVSTTEPASGLVSRLS